MAEISIRSLARSDKLIHQILAFLRFIDPLRCEADFLSDKFNGLSVGMSFRCAFEDLVKEKGVLEKTLDGLDE